MNWFVQALHNYADFKGRAQRSEYWYFLLFYTGILFVLSLLDSLFGRFNAAAGVGLLSGLFAVGMLVPSLAVGVRRLHDTGRSGWWLLLSLLPILGALWLLYVSVQDSDSEPNRFGPNPKLRGNWA